MLSLRENMTDLIPTPEQRAIIERQSGPLLVLAGVGSGKTLVLAQRAAYALDRGVPADSLLAITFTNRAAQELRSRLALTAPGAGRTATICTFHAFCARVLRLDGHLLEIERNFAIWDDADSKEAIRLAAEAMGRPLDAQTVDERYAELGRLKRQTIYPVNWATEKNRRQGDREFQRFYRLYQEQLKTSNALDYDDLIAQTLTLFKKFPEVLRRWSEQFSWVEVDEFQDTLDIEYDVLSLLTRPHQNLCVFGDKDQSIFRWRGVDSQRVITRFRADFPGHAQYQLSQNFRSSALIQQAARGVLGIGWEPAPAAALPAGEPVRIHAARSEQDEAEYLARRVRELRQQGTDWRKIAVLARTRQQVARIAQAFGAVDIPYATVSAAEYFQRPAVKVLAAYLRLIARDDTTDLIALRRIADRPPRGLPAVLLNAIEREGRGCYLRLTDLVNEAALQEGDPCGYELDVAGREYVVVDVEATGIDLKQDEIVEIAALQVDPTTGDCHEFSQLIRPRRAVAASFHQHGYSDDHLRAHGGDAAEALSAFRAFVGSRPLVGHNLDAYDVPLLNQNLRRHGLPELTNRTVDTLAMARRVLRLDRYDLARVRKVCGVEAAPSHQALADARCAAACFQVLAARLRATAAERRALLGRLRGRFEPLAHLLGRWQERARSSVLSELVAAVLTESGYWAWLQAQGPEGRAAQRTLNDLRLLIEQRFDRYAPDQALRAFLDYLSLTRSADRFGQEEDRALILTLHSAKGLEFDAVFIAGAHDESIPISHSRTEEAELAEERRLLYVGMTRARRRLELTYPRSRTAGASLRPAWPSRFLEQLPPGLVVYTRE